MGSLQNKTSLKENPHCLADVNSFCSVHGRTMMSGDAGSEIQHKMKILGIKVIINFGHLDIQLALLKITAEAIHFVLISGAMTVMDSHHALTLIEVDYSQHAEEDPKALKFMLYHILKS